MSYTTSDSWPASSKTLPWPKDEATQILNALDKYQIAYWGFVIIRCTYASEEKWDRFLVHLRELAQGYFQYETGPTEHVYEMMAWTIIEDAETLDGADILQTSRMFDEWVTKGQGLQEMRGSRFTAEWHYSPRYTYFLHVDEESLESVVDEEKKLAPGGYFCTVVRAGNVLIWLIWEEELLTGQCYDSEVDKGELDDDSEDLRDHRKRVRVDDLMSLYGVLQEDLDLWYRIYYIELGEEIGCLLSHAYS